MNNIVEQLQSILGAIEDAGGRALIVGGAVRDMLMGQDAKDLDIEVYGLDVDRLIGVLARFGRVDAVGRSFGVLKMRLPDGRELDVSLPRRESAAGARGALGAPDPAMTPREAAARRDFTWNALALNPAGELLDFFGGAADLRAGIIRHTSAAFGEDPLRVLRAMQFAARFDMRLAPETVTLCRTLLPLAPDLAIERVWGEWLKWAIKGKRPSAGLRVLEETGWIGLYPELEALIGCLQDSIGIRRAMLPFIPALSATPPPRSPIAKGSAASSAPGCCSGRCATIWASRRRRPTTPMGASAAWGTPRRASRWRSCCCGGSAARAASPGRWRRWFASTWRTTA